MKRKVSVKAWAIERWGQILASSVRGNKVELRKDWFEPSSDKIVRVELTRRRRVAR